MLVGKKNKQKNGKRLPGKKIARILLAALILTFSVSNVPCFFMTVHAETLDNAAVEARLKTEKEKFPPGKYWNHVGSNDNNVNGVTDSPCPDSRGTHLTHNSTCNAYSDESGNVSWQCMGFAKKVCYDMFSADIWDDNYWENGSIENLAVGDYVRIPGHSFVVAKVEGETVTKYECNWSGFCLITCSNTMTKTDLRDKLNGTWDGSNRTIRHFKANYWTEKTMPNVVERSRVAALAYAELGTTGGSKYYNSGESGAWQVYFARWCVRQAGMNSASWPDMQRTTKTVQWFQGCNRWYDKVSYQWSYTDVSGGGSISNYIPQVGDMAAIESSNDADGPETLGLVYRINITDDVIDVIVGNVDNKVVLQSFRLLDLHLKDNSDDAVHIIGFGEPDYGKTVRDPLGAVELIEGGKGTIRVKGWAFDQDNLSGSLQIAVYIGGDEKSGMEKHVITANRQRTDINQKYGNSVGNNHGFDETIIVNVRGNQTIYVYAQDVGNPTLSNTDIGSQTVKTVSITDPVIAVIWVGLNTGNLTLETGQSRQLTATVTPSNATNPAVTWKSSDTNIAMVDGNGRVTAKAKGAATITATTLDGNKTAECKVTVTIKETDSGETEPDSPSKLNETLVGDINGDGFINRADRIYLARYLANWSGYTLKNAKAADVNKDGSVNRADRIYLARYLANWEWYTLN